MPHRIKKNIIKRKKWYSQLYSIYKSHKTGFPVLCKSSAGHQTPHFETKGVLTFFFFAIFDITHKIE